MIAAVLLVPAEGDPHGLLADGPCGARPPVARWRLCDDCGGWWGEGISEYFCGACGKRTDRKHNRSALVLAWEGKAVWLGLSQLAEAAGFSTDLMGLWLQGVMQDRPYMGMPRVTARVEKLGLVVLLDANGQELAP